MGEFLSRVHIWVLCFLEGFLQRLHLLVRKLGTTPSLLASDEEVILEAAVRVTWGKGTEGLQIVACGTKLSSTSNHYKVRRNTPRTKMKPKKKSLFKKIRTQTDYIISKLLFSGIQKLSSKRLS